MIPPAVLFRAGLSLLAGLVVASSTACDTAPVPTPLASTRADSVTRQFRNVSDSVPYVGDSTCVGCHAAEAASYAQHSMARSFHAWTPEGRIEKVMGEALRNAPTGYAYKVVDSAGALWQVETRPEDGAAPTHELRRRMDYVMGSGRLARTYFTEENGRLFQLPLTWYADHGWDFSPGYELNNARFSRVMPDRCIACHASYPTPAAHLEGKYPVLRPGIGCERCHGPGALHVRTKLAAAKALPVRDSIRAHTFDSTIVNPTRLPLDRRMDVCEQCHVHTSVAVLRQNRKAFDFTPAQQLEAQYAYFKNGGDIDLVSHADRLKQSACYISSIKRAAPLECATCHNPHAPPATKATRNQPCLSCHAGSTLAARFTAGEAKRTHAPTTDCVGCHMPVVKERTVPHGTFSDHWIRVPGAQVQGAAKSAAPIEAYYARDKSGPEGALYTAMGTVVFASLSGSGDQFDAAATALTPLLHGNTTHPQAHFLLGIAHQARGRHKEAAVALREALRLGDSTPDVLRAMAQATRQQGDADKAGELYLRALRMQPALAWMRAEYADLLQQQGALPEAVAEYRAALLEQPSLAAASFNLGIALLSQGEATAAAEALLNAIRLEPTYASALDATFRVKGTGKRVTALGAIPSPVSAVRTVPRGPSAFRVVAAGAQQLTFVNTPPGGFVLVYTPDGTLLLAVPTSAGGTVSWDLRTGDGRVVAPGLYRAEVQARGLVPPLPTQWFAIVGAR